MKKVRLQRNLVTRKTKLLSPFIKKYRERVAISEVPEPMRSVLLGTVQSDDGKLVFVKNCKAASTRRCCTNTGSSGNRVLHL